jgi:hypothetical protein
MDSRLSARFLALAVTFAVLLVGVNSVTGATHSETPVPAQLTIGEGAWSWFADPRAVYYAGAHRRTYVGWVGDAGDIRVLAYDYDTHSIATAVLQHSVEADDHANPAIVVRPDRRLEVFYSAHNGAFMYYRISTKPEEISSWGPIQLMPGSTPPGYTYPNPIHLAAEHTTYLFWRAGDGSPTNSAQEFSTQPDGSDAWSLPKPLLGGQGGRAYVKYDSHGADTIGMAFTNGNPLETTDTNVYYAYYRHGRLFSADGSPMGAMGQPLRTTPADAVYKTGTKAWVHDIAFEASGQPVIVYAVFPTRSDHVYMYSRWDGRKWVTHAITHAGGSFDPDTHIPEPYYSGGLSLNHADPSLVYLSKESGSTFEIQTWHTADHGAKWSHTDVTSNSQSGNYRPISPRGLPPGLEGLRVIWMGGLYKGYIGYQTSIRATDTTQRLVAAYDASSKESAAFAHLLGGRAPVTVAFDAAASQSPAAQIVSWSWNFGDGSTGSGERVSHRYTKRGDHFATLTITDDRGMKSTFVSDVVVERAAGGRGPSRLEIAAPALLVLAGLVVLGRRARIRRRPRPRD